jgi:hypothetical protein
VIPCPPNDERGKNLLRNIQMSPRLIAFGACICIYLGAFAQDKPPAPAVDKPESVAPLSKDEETRVMELIKALGADDLEVRDKATEDLKAFGERAEALLKAAANDADAEIRSRVQCVLKSVALRKRATFSKASSNSSRIFTRSWLSPMAPPSSRYFSNWSNTMPTTKAAV